MRRSKLMTLRLTPDELQRWHAMASAHGLSLAELIRQRLGEAEFESRPRRRRQPPPADPALLAALGRIGNNLNQLARVVNTYKSAVDAAQVVAVLLRIERSLDRILSSYRPEDGEGDALQMAETRLGQCPESGSVPAR